MRNVLRVVITFLLLAELSASFAQFPGCPQVETANNVLVPCGQTCTNLYATAQGGYATTTYTYAAIPYAPPVPFNQGTAIPIPGSNGDDYWSPEITLPFSFCYFGNTYTHVVVSSNGAISFDVANANLIPSSWDITGPAPANNPSDMLNCVMTPWQDLDNTHQGQIYYSIGGTAPCQYFTASWYNCAMYGDAESTNTGYCTLDDHQYQQVVLYQTSNVIDINIQSKATPCDNDGAGYWNNGWAIEGLENANGTVFIGPAARNATRWAATDDAMRFTPGGTPIYTVTWFQNGTQIGTGSPISVCPTGPTKYTVQAVYQACGGGTITVSDSVFVSLAHLNVTTSSTQPSCGSDNGSVVADFNSNSGVISYGWSPGGAGDTVLHNIGPGTYIFTASDSAGCTASDTVHLAPAGGLIVTLANDTIPCTTDSGTLHAIVDSGNGPFTYLWSNGDTSARITGLVPGTYTVIVNSSGGCADTVSATVVLTSSSPVVINTIKIQDVTCNGGANGEIEVIASGGPPPYSYQWSDSVTGVDSITGLTAGTYGVRVIDRFGCYTDSTYNITQPAPITFDTPVITPVTCYGDSTGRITVTATGGNPPYTYAWGNGIAGATDSNLTAGTYTVTATDTAGCTGTATFTVGQSAPIIFGTPVIDSVSCFGGSDGSITVNATGGTGPITFRWNVNNDSTATAGNLSIGTYTVTATDSLGCTASASYTVNQPTQLVVDSFTLDSATCSAGGAIIVTAGGGTPPYSFAWSNQESGDSIGGLAGGSYTVTITDSHGCSITASASVPAAPGVLTFGTPIIVEPTCHGSANGSITAVGVGGNGTITYSWSNIDSLAKDSNLVAGTYSVTISDSVGCSASTTYILGQPDTLVISNAVIDSPTCNGFNNGSIIIAVTGGTTPYSYVWTPNQSSSDSALNLGAGSYSVVVTDSNGCTASATYNVNQPSPIVIDSATVTPVGCTTGGSIVVAASGGTGTLTYSWTPTGSGDSIGNLVVGTYTLTITDQNGCSITASYVVNAVASAVSITTANITNITCNGDSTGIIQVIASDSSVGGSISYSWSNGDTGSVITGLTAGPYCVTVTDSLGCSVSACYSVTQPNAITFGNPIYTQPSCYSDSNGCIIVSATGGTGTITYVWNNSAVGDSNCGIPAGTYTVTAFDSAGCSATASFTLSQPNPDSVTLVATNITCNGSNNGIIVATGSGGTGAFSYTWAPAAGNAGTIINLAPGTYCVTAKDANGCTAAGCDSITQPSAIVINALVPTPVTCAGLGQDSVSASGGTGTLTYVWSTTGTGAVITGLSAGAYCVIVTDSLFCTATGCDTVTNTAGTVTIDSAHITNATCTTTGSIVVFALGGNTGLTYSWTGGLTGDSIGGLAAGTYSVTVSDSTGCSATASYTVNPATQVAITNVVIDSTKCNGDSTGSITFTATGNGTLVYFWSPGVSSDDTALGLAAGQYCVTITDSTGCSATACYTVGQPTPITVSGIVTNGACGQPGSIAVTASGGTGTLSIGWMPNTASGFNPTGLAAGTYIATVTDQNLCTKVDTFVVTSSGGTPITISNVVIDSVSCFGGNNGSITVTATGGSGPLGYAWSNFEIGNTDTALFANTYTVTVADTAGCSITASYTVGQPNAITVTGSVTNASCNTPGSISVVASGGTGALNISWNPGTVSGFNPTGLPAGTYIATVTDQHGCQKVDTFTVTGSSGTLTISDVITNVTCNGLSDGAITVTPSGGSGYGYTWSPNVGTGATVTSLAAGTYDVTVTATGGCSVTATYNVTAPAPIVLTLNAPAALCVGTDSGKASVTVVSGGTGPFHYHWSNNADTLATDTGLQPGNVAVTVTDGNGCTASASQSVKQDIFDIGPVIIQPNCAAPIPKLEVSITLPGTPPYTYSDNNGLTTFTTDSNSFTFDSIYPGNYPVVVRDSNGCTVSEVDTVKVPPAIDSVTAYATPTSCSTVDNGMVSVDIAVSDSSHGPFQFSLNGGPYVSDSIFDSLAPGTYNIVVLNNLGCYDTVSTPLVVTTDSVLKVYFNPDTLGYPAIDSDTIVLSPNIVGFVNPIYQWSPATGLTCTSCPNPTMVADPSLVPSGPAVYRVLVYDSLTPQCAAYDSIYIQPKGQVIMPNAFTPNGDGKDDFFGPVKYSYATIITFHIYNRWGQLVHDAPIPWDGKFKGKDQPEGTYVYYIEVTMPNGYDYNTIVTWKKEGSVILLR